MARPDLNLLVTLDVLLREGSVVRASRKLNLSPSAMSRALARLRAATGDPLLVRAGRVLVPSPRALKLRDRVADLVRDAETALQPERPIDLLQLQRTFSLRTREGFVETFGPALIARLHAEAPQVKLHFIGKRDHDSAPLRDGTVDLETGVVARTMGPELRAQALFADRFVGVAQAGHSLSRGRITAARFAAASHVTLATLGRDHDVIDAALKRLSLQRTAPVIVESFGSAIELARRSNLVACVPERHTSSLRDGLFTFVVPLPLPSFTVSLLWHPRHEADAAHQWLRRCVREVCRASSG